MAGLLNGGLKFLADFLVKDGLHEAAGTTGRSSDSAPSDFENTLERYSAGEEDAPTGLPEHAAAPPSLRPARFSGSGFQTGLPPALRGAIKNHPFASGYGLDKSSTPSEAEDGASSSDGEQAGEG